MAEDSAVYRGMTSLETPKPRPRRRRVCKRVRRNHGLKRSSGSRCPLKSMDAVAALAVTCAFHGRPYVVLPLAKGSERRSAQRASLGIRLSYRDVA